MLKAATGVNKKRIVKLGVIGSGLCSQGSKYLLDKNLLQKDDIDALILVTQSPDYIIPPTSNVIKEAVGLVQDILCVDINQACAGYYVGLIQ